MTARSGGPKRPLEQTAQDAAALAEWNSKKWVWASDPVEGYLAGWVVKEEEGMSTVAISSPSGEQVRQIASHDLTRVNPPTFDGAEDIADLTYLNEASVVHNLRTRYHDGAIYTYSGLFLVAVNPYRDLGIYTPEIIERYKNRRRDQNPPHVFAVAEKAWQNMLQHRDQSQSVLVTGESGAGKTENTKKVIQYLAAIAADPMPSSSSFDLLARQTAAESRILDKTTGKKLGQLERQILEANPILEAFGNAQTVKNNNSSRFGKFVRIFFNPVGAIAGANIDYYLLEKSRVTGRSEHERNFHIFFQLLRGADQETKKQLLLSGGPSEYEYLKHSRQDVDRMDDKQEWTLLQRALDTVGFSRDEQLQLFRIIAAILHLGNISVGGPDTAHIRDRAELEKVCFLLGLDDSEFLNALVRPKVKAGREWVVQARTAKQVVDELAALAKALYEKNFGAMVDRINKALGRPSTKTFIGVLDIAGFEIFETNGFEQLCINLTNEKLQQFFNHHMFVLEQEEYAREEIAWQFVNFGLELQPTIDLIESNNPMGILSCLDDASIMPKASDKSFTTKLHQLASDKPVAPQYTKYTASRLEQGFTVSHYAGKVEYRTEGWLEKNRDPLNDNITSLLSKANDNYVATLFAEYAEPDPSTVAADGPRTRVRKGAFRTVGQRHKEQLSFLMAQLRDTQPHFVRCIVPNLLKSPGKIDVPLVLDQLRCNGVLEGIRIARLGYPNRLPFSEFRRRFDLLAPNLIPKGFVDGGQACDKILKSLQLDSDAYRLGLTKVFFKAGILAELEERRDEVLSDIVTRIQATCRKFVARRQATKVLHRAAAIRTIQRNARVYVQLRAWPWWPLFQRVRPLLAAARNDDEMRRKEEELAAAKEAAEREQVERERLQAVQRELEATQAKMEESLASERALSEEKQMLLLRSKEREQELQTALAAAEQDVETVDRQLDRAMEAKTELDRRVADLNEAYANQNRLLETLQTEQVEWKAREAKLADQTSVQTAEWEKMVKDRQDGISKARDLERKLAEEAQDRKREQDRVAVEKAALERRLATQVTDSTEARQKFVALETEARTAKEDLAGLQRLKRELESTVKAKESELARLTSEQAAAGKQRDDAVSRARDVDSRLAKVSNELADTKRALESSRVTQEKAATDLITLKKLLDDQTTDHQRSAELSKLKETELQDVRLELSKTSSRLAIVERDSSNELARLRQDLHAAARQASDLKSKNADLSRQVTSSTTRITDLESRNLTLERAQQAHDLELELFRTKAAETMLQEREKWEKSLAETRAQFQELEDAAVQARREKDAAKRDVAAGLALLASERATVAEKEKARLRLEDQVEQQHVVLADLDKINGDLRSELGATKARLLVAEEKAGRTVVEHVRVLEEAQRLQNAEMDRIRAKDDQRDAHVRTLERALASRNQALEDIQHEREMERRQAFTNRPAKDMTAARISDELASEKKLRQLAELNITRLQSEIQHQQSQLEKASRDMNDLRRANAQAERELNLIASSDATESLVYPQRDRRMQESRVANTISNMPSARAPIAVKQALPQSPRRRNYE